MKKLKPAQREFILRNDLSAKLISVGFNIYLPVFDEGIDLIAHNEQAGELLLIQQKSRFTINKKYENRNIWMAFPDKGEWFIVPHDDLLSCQETLGYQSSRSWIERDGYSIGGISEKLRDKCKELCILHLKYPEF